jgi:hypothetical protein
MITEENIGIEDPEMLDLIKKELFTGWQASAVMAEIRQRRVAEANSRIRGAMIEGIGQHTMSVDADAYWFWNWKEPGCWKDKGFRTEFLKKNPHCAAPKAERKIRITR